MTKPFDLEAWERSVNLLREASDQLTSSVDESEPACDCRVIDLPPVNDECPICRRPK